MLPIELDVTDRDAAFAAVAKAHGQFGSLDVVVNNAGYGLFGMVEEVTEEQARRQIDTNLLGPLWVTQATLPVLREPGPRAHHPGVVGRRRVRTARTRALSRVEVGPGRHDLQPGDGGPVVRNQGDLGRAGRIRHRLAGLLGRAGHRNSPAYDEFRANLPISASARRGDPAATGPAILAIVDAEEPPLRVFFGDQPLPLLRTEYAQRIAEWEAWDDLSRKAFG